ncbi:MAG: hypothetical protein NTX02_15070 [Planctomycetia bacterium]|nr:hypothetical protein [Planctomycetia bacterium]
MPTPDVAAARGRSLRYRVPCLACKLVVIVAVELVPGATPVMVAKAVPSPLSVIPTEPDAVAVPAHV